MRPPQPTEAKSGVEATRILVAISRRLLHTNILVPNTLACRRSFYLFFIQMRLNFTTHLQMVSGPVFVGDEVLASNFGMP